MSGYQSLANRYREVAVSTATPLQLIVMLYDEAICSLQEARGHLERKDIGSRSRALNKSIAIISELQSCLNLQAGGEIASSLNRLYDYMKRRIFRANVEQSIQPIAEVEILLENLRAAWRELVGQSSATPAQAAEQTRSNHQMAGTPTPVGGMQPKPFSVSV
jgi:flagellar secretion chaperone FliS